MLDYIALIALAGVVFGVSYIIYLNKIHEKEIATKHQKDFSFGMTISRGYDWNISDCVVCRRFSGIGVGCSWGIFKLCFWIANLSFL